MIRCEARSYVSSCRAQRRARTAFPSFAIYAHRLTGADGRETKMINWSFLSFPGSVLQTRGPRVSRTGRNGIPDGNRTPRPFCITANRPCWTGLDFAYWLSRRDCGNERVARKSDDGEGRCHVSGGGGGKRSRVKSAVLMLSILVLSIMRTGSAG